MDRHGRTATTYYTCIIRAFENLPTEKKTGRSSDHLAPNANAARIRKSTRASSFEGTPKTAPCIKRTHFTRVHTLPTRVQRVQTPPRRKVRGGEKNSYVPPKITACTSISWARIRSTIPASGAATQNTVQNIGRRVYRPLTNAMPQCTQARICKTLRQANAKIEHTSLSSPRREVN